MPTVSSQIPYSETIEIQHHLAASSVSPGFFSALLELRIQLHYILL